MRAGTFSDGWVNMARFWRALFTANGAFSINDPSLAALLNLLTGGMAGAGQGFTTEQLQTELDKIDVNTAKQYRDALKILIDDYVDVCYTGIENITHTETPRPMNIQVQTPSPGLAWGTWNGQKSGYVQWNSAHFLFQATIFHIVPATANHRWEIGFVQHCTRKENYGHYSNGDRMHDGPPQPAPWNDSGRMVDYPWYTKGNHNGHTAWAPLAAGIQTVAYGMDDSFNNRKHPYRPVRPGTGVVTTEKITQVRCRQTFIAWLSRFNSSTQSRLLLKQADYSITGEFNIDVLNQISASISNVTVDTWVTPVLNATLPVTNVQSMNNSEKWFSNNTPI